MWGGGGKQVHGKANAGQDMQGEGGGRRGNDRSGNGGAESRSNNRHP
jgi:hypothetical protein